MRLLPKDPELGWTPYAWLIYFVPFLVYPAMRGTSALEWGLTAAGAVAFLALYFLGFWFRDLRVAWCAGGILLLGILFAPYNYGTSSFFVYAASFVAWARPPRLAWGMIAAVVGVLAVEAWIVPLSPYVWIPGGIFSLLIGAINLHASEVKRSNAKLRMAQAEVEQLAKTAERERIARDLHDLLGHTLSLVTLKSALAGKLIDRDPERAKREIEEVERVSREALREVRAAVAGYRSEGLQAELARSRMALEAVGVKLEYFAAPVELDPDRETVLALALREAVTNVMRHAGAATCRISIEPTDGEVRMEVKDDGRGGLAPEGTGLSAMRERVHGLGGRVERRGEGGTTIVVTLPYRPPALGEDAGPEPGRAALREEPA